MNITKKLLTLCLVCILILSASASVFACEKYYKTDLPNWMSYIKDDVQLNQLTIPATHDSGAYNPKSVLTERGVLRFMNSFADAQYLSILGQLEMGIRMFDLRYATDDLIVYHGYQWDREPIGMLAGPVASFQAKTLCGKPLDIETIFKEFSLFIKNHPSEAIFFTVKDENEFDTQSKKEELAAKFNDLAKKYGVNDLDSEKLDEELSNFRGKVWFVKSGLSRFEYNKIFTKYGNKLYELTREDKVNELFDEINYTEPVSSMVDRNFMQHIGTNISFRLGGLDITDPQGELPLLMFWSVKDQADYIKKHFFKKHPFVKAETKEEAKAYGFVSMDYPQLWQISDLLDCNLWALKK